MTPDQKEAAACLQDAETLLQKVKDTRKHGPARFSADAQQQENNRLHLAWELLLSAKAAR